MAPDESMIHAAAVLQPAEGTSVSELRQAASTDTKLTQMVPHQLFKAGTEFPPLASSQLGQSTYQEQLHTLTTLLWLQASADSCDQLSTSLWAPMPGSCASPAIKANRENALWLVEALLEESFGSICLSAQSAQTSHSENPAKVRRRLCNCLERTQHCCQATIRGSHTSGYV